MVPTLTVEFTSPVYVAPYVLAVEVVEIAIVGKLGFRPFGCDERMK